MLRDEIIPYQNDNHILVYCGAASLKDFHSDTYPVDDDEIRQIDVITDLLGNQMDMNVSRIPQRKILKNAKLSKSSLQKVKY